MYIQIKIASNYFKGLTHSSIAFRDIIFYY